MPISIFPILAPRAKIGVLLVCMAVVYLAATHDPVSEFTIYSPTAAPPATQADTPWLRNVSIRVKSFDGPSGIPAADDFVDILLFRTIDGQERSSVFISEIRVIAAERPDVTPPSDLMVLVEVDTNQAMKLAVAQQNGVLALVPHEAGLFEDQLPPNNVIQHGPYRVGEMPVIPYGDYTPPPGGGILH